MQLYIKHIPAELQIYNHFLPRSPDTSDPGLKFIKEKKTVKTGGKVPNCFDFMQNYWDTDVQLVPGPF